MAWKQQYQMLKSRNVENPGKKAMVQRYGGEDKMQRKSGPVLLLCDANSNLLDQDQGKFLSNTGMYNLGA
eukprot:1685627-Ditylum_brightwellii.AAC.1